MIAGRFGDKGQQIVLFGSGDQKVQVNSEYVARIQKYYPDVEWETHPQNKNMVCAVSNGEVVGIIIGLEGGPEHKGTTTSHRRISDVAEVGPHAADGFEFDSLRNEVVSNSNPKIRAKVEGTKDFGYYVTAGNNIRTRLYKTKAQAVKAAEELLSHVHKVHSYGSYVFKPKKDE